MAIITHMYLDDTYRSIDDLSSRPTIKRNTNKSSPKKRDFFILNVLYKKVLKNLHIGVIGFLQGEIKHSVKKKLI